MKGFGILTSMVRLNKTQLTNNQLTALFTQLSELFGKLNSNQTNLVFSELLGPEEKIMIAKRLAIIILLLEDKSLYKISKLLKVSAATAEKMKIGLESGRFEETLSVLNSSKKDYFKVLETLDSILHLGGVLPHYNGIDRYRI